MRIIGVLFVLFFSFSSVSANTSSEILIKYYGDESLYLKQVDTSIIEDKIAELRENVKIEYAEQNFKYQAAIIPSDSYFSNQWYLKRIKAVDAWDEKREVPEITIAIIDSGVQINHPDLKDNIWRNKKEIDKNGIDDDKNGFVDDINGWDFVNSVNNPEPKFKEGFTSDGIIHGTVVAGIAAGFGNNGMGVSGVAWQAKIMSLKVLDDRGEGDTRKVVKAIDYAVLNGADIINLSFVGFGYSQVLNDAIRRAYNSGVFVVAAAGNDEGGGGGVNIDERPMYPACHDGAFGENMVIGVSATDPLDQKAPFSSYGHKCIDIAAPGVSIFSTTVFAPEHNTAKYSFNKKYDGFWSGTSMAAPMVSGALALAVGTYPQIGVKGIRDVMIKTAYNINALNPMYIDKLGRGRLDVSATIKKLDEFINLTNNYLLVTPVSKKEPFIILESFSGNKKNEFFAYDENFRGGVNVATGDVDGDGIDEIITGAGRGGGPHVKIFKANSQLVGGFMAFDKNNRNGINVASGYFNSGSKGVRASIVVAEVSDGEPLVKTFNLEGKIEKRFLAFHKKFRGGVNLSTGDFDKDGFDEIVTAAGPGGAPHIRVFTRFGILLSSFYAFNDEFEGGVNASVIDLKYN